MAASMSTNVFSQMMDDPSLFESQYDVVAGGWPQNPDELVLALTVNGGISDFVLYAMGLRDPAELDAMVQQLVNDEPIVTPDGTKSFSYDDLMAMGPRIATQTGATLGTSRHVVYLLACSGQARVSAQSPAVASIFRLFIG